MLIKKKETEKARNIRNEWILDNLTRAVLIQAINDLGSTDQDILSLLTGTESSVRVSIAPLNNAQGHEVLSSEGSIAVLSTSKKPQYVIKTTPIEKYRKNENILTRLREDSEPHPNLIKIFTITKLDMALHLSLFYPLDLHELMIAVIDSQQFQLESTIIEALKEVKSGLDHLHKIRTTHKDIKPENLLAEIKNGQLLITITDFGLSQTFEMTTTDDKKVTWTLGGSPTYYSPIHIQILAILYRLIPDTENKLSSEFKTDHTLSYETVKAIDLFCLLLVIKAIKDDFTWQDKASSFYTSLNTQPNIEQAKKYYMQLRKDSLWTLDSTQMTLDSEKIREQLTKAMDYKTIKQQDPNENLRLLTTLITANKLKPGNSTQDKKFTHQDVNGSNNGPAEVDDPQRTAAEPLAHSLGRSVVTGPPLSNTTTRRADRHAANPQPPAAPDKSLRPASQPNAALCSCNCM